MISDSLCLSGSHLRMSHAAGECLGEQRFGQVDPVQTEARHGLSDQALARRVGGGFIGEHGALAFDQAHAVRQRRRGGRGTGLARPAPGRQCATGRRTSAETPIHEWPAEPISIASTCQTAPPLAPIPTERKPLADDLDRFFNPAHYQLTCHAISQNCTPAKSTIPPKLRVLDPTPDTSTLVQGFSTNNAPCRKIRQPMPTLLELTTD
jgi:hypothetical protein